MASSIFTVREVLGWTTERFRRAGLPTARLDAEVLLAHAVGCDRIGLYVDLERAVAPEARAAYRELLTRRLERVPVAYLTGQKEFWSRTFSVDARVLVPRPETELLVERALVVLRELPAPRVLDVGTGSGALAITLALERQDAEVTATDVSSDALDVARANAARLGARVAFHAGDLLEALPSAAPPFHLIVANLPYVAEAERPRLEPELHHEPALALFAPEDGLALIRRLAATGRGRLVTPGGHLLLELGMGQRAEVEEALVAGGFTPPITFHKDYAGIARIACAGA
jgi:release factor glutamine methyltransferase